MSRSVIPVVLVGRQPEVGTVVTENLKPEVEVIHFISTPEAAKEDLPRLLQHRLPSNDSDGGVGTQTYSRPAEAILLGLGYTNEIIEDLRQACKGVEPGVPWLAGGLSKDEMEEMLRTNPPPSPEKYGPITAGKVKKALLNVMEEGKGGKDGVYYWHER